MDTKLLNLEIQVFGNKFKINFKIKL